MIKRTLLNIFISPDPNKPSKSDEAEFWTNLILLLEALNLEFSSSALRDELADGRPFSIKRAIIHKSENTALVSLFAPDAMQSWSDQKNAEYLESRISIVESLLVKRKICLIIKDNIIHGFADWIYAYFKNRSEFFEGCPINQLYLNCNASTKQCGKFSSVMLIKDSFLSKIIFFIQIR